MSNNYITILGKYKINLNGRSVSYVLKQSRKARLIWLKIHAEDGLTLTVPRQYDVRLLEKFLISKSSWILKHLNHLQNRNASAYQEQINSVYYLGTKFRLIRINKIITQNIHIDFDKKAILLSDKLKESEMLITLRNHFFNQSKTLIEKKVAELSKTMSVKYNQIYIRDQKTRWGSCSIKNNLSFNWRLVMMPEKVIDYVIIHELCHLKSMNHSSSFWILVASYCPDWKVYRTWLRIHNFEIRKLI